MYLLLKHYQQTSKFSIRNIEMELNLVLPRFGLVDSLFIKQSRDVKRFQNSSKLNGTS